MAIIHNHSIWMWVWVSVHVHVPLHPVFECNTHRSIDLPSSQVAINHVSMHSCLCQRRVRQLNSDLWARLVPLDLSNTNLPDPLKTLARRQSVAGSSHWKMGCRAQGKDVTKGARWSQRRGTRRRKEKKSQQIGKGNDLFRVPLVLYKQTNKVTNQPSN